MLIKRELNNIKMVNIIFIGLAGSPLVAAVFLYDKNNILGWFLAIMGVIFIATVIISEIVLKHKELPARIRGFIR